MRLKTFIYGVSCAVWLAGCRPASKTVEYSDLQPPKYEKSYVTEILNDDYLFSFPQSLIQYDSLLIVKDYHNREACFHVFSTDGRFLYSFGYKGKGPGEIIYPRTLSIDKKNRCLIVWDSNQKKLLRYQLPLAAGDSIRYLDQIENPLNSSYFSDIIAHDTDYYALGHVYPLRFGRLTPDSVATLYSDYPLLTEDEEANRSCWYYSHQTRITDDGSRMVQTCYVGAAMEIFSLENDQIHSEKVLAITPPVYRIVEGAQPKWVGLIDETVLGFIDVQVSDRFIYAILSNRPLTADDCEGSASIWIFDWDANPVGKMNLDRHVEVFCVDEQNGTIYAVSNDLQSGEYQLVRFNFNPNDFAE